MTTYSKFIVALVVAILSAAFGALDSAHGQFTQATAINTVLAVLGAVAVYLGPNVKVADLPPALGFLSGSYTKMLLAVLTAVATALASYIGAGGHLQSIPPAEVVQILLVAAGAIGVAAVPNVAPIPVPTPAKR